MASTRHRLDISLEHLGKRAQIALCKNIVIEFNGFRCVEIALFGAGDRDWGTVHIHLAISDFVEPGPGERIFAGLHLGGDEKLEGAGPRTVGVLAKISCCISRAAAFDAQDDEKFRAGRRLEIFGERNLTTASPVNRRPCEA